MTDVTPPARRGRAGTPARVWPRAPAAVERVRPRGADRPCLLGLRGNASRLRLALQPLHHRPPDRHRHHDRPRHDGGDRDGRARSFGGRHRRLRRHGLRLPCAERGRAVGACHSRRHPVRRWPRLHQRLCRGALRRPQLHHHARLHEHLLRRDDLPDPGAILQRTRRLPCRPWASCASAARSRSC